MLKFPLLTSSLLLIPFAANAAERDQTTYSPRHEIIRELTAPVEPGLLERIEAEQKKRREQLEISREVSDELAHHLNRRKVKNGEGEVENIIPSTSTGPIVIGVHEEPLTLEIIEQNIQMLQSSDLEDSQIQINRLIREKYKLWEKNNLAVDLESLVPPSAPAPTFLSDEQEQTLNKSEYVIQINKQIQDVQQHQGRVQQKIKGLQTNYEKAFVAFSDKDVEFSKKINSLSNELNSQAKQELESQLMAKRLEFAQFQKKLTTDIENFQKMIEECQSFIRELESQKVELNS